MAGLLIDDVGLSWLVTVRWTGLAAAVAALAFGSRALHLPIQMGVAAVLLTVSAASNVWLARANRARRLNRARAGVLVSADVLILTWCLIDAGGIVNPASVYLLVDIVVAALVLGPAWTWGVTALSVGGYSLQFLFRTSDLSAALAMHPQIAEHVRGMWIAFIGSAVLIAGLVARLATAVDRRDRALDALRIEADRAARMTALATLTAGAAHELSTPLGTIAVAAGEIAHALDRGTTPDALRADVSLIRDEVSRCKVILDAMSGRARDHDPPTPTSLQTLVTGVLGRLSADDRQRIAVSGGDAELVWPIRAVAAAVHGVVRNALDASRDARVGLNLAADGACVRVIVTDDGPGMTADRVVRAGEPFYTTKPAGAGMGLGLFVSRTTIEHLGGTFAIASAPRAGTTVTMSLPLTISAGAP